MRLLKIGTLNVPNNRWEDALDVFSEIVVFCFPNERELVNDRIKYIYLPSSYSNRLLLRIINAFAKIKMACYISYVLICIFRVLNLRTIRLIKSIKFDAVHSSYNDFDHSDLLTIILNVKNYTRAQKETRIKYNFCEKLAFLRAQRLVLNSQLNKELFISKYGNIFKDKTVLYNLDEDVRGKDMCNIALSNKLSSVDKRIHAVILAGRVLSTPHDKRSGGRLYYIPLIEKLLSNNIIVHLHTNTIIEYNGYNPYIELSQKNPNLIIEKKLDFIQESTTAYKVLSRYDIGILHAHIQGHEVTEFDRINIPHRYYEYHLAHVIPVDIIGQNRLIDEKAKENKAIVVKEFSELSLDKISKIKWETPTFSQYIYELYGNLYSKNMKQSVLQEKNSNE